MRSRPYQNRSLPVFDWPEADRRAWELAIAAPDAFDGVITRVQKWTVSTRVLVASTYGHWLAWLIGTAQMDAEASAGERASRARVVAFRDHMRERGLADYTVSARIRHLGDALEAMEPEGAFQWINLAASRLHATAKPRKNVREIMQPPEDIFQLGVDLMDAAERDRFRTETDRATLFRDGLLLCILTLRPLRLANLASLEIADGLQEGDVWRIRIAEEETKNHTAIEAPWPRELADSLDRYLSKHRPVLLRTAKGNGKFCPALWISRQAGPMTMDAIYMQIKSRTKDQFGTAINPHAFRHIAATAIATFRPDEAITIMDVLSHSAPRTAERYYNLAQTVGAGARLQASVSEARRQAGVRARAHKALGVDMDSRSPKAANVRL